MLEEPRDELARMSLGALLRALVQRRGSLKLNETQHSSTHALVDELRKRNTEESILEFEEKFNSRNEKNLHIYICRFLKNRSISRALASKWLITMINDKELKINSLKN